MGESPSSGDHFPAPKLLTWSITPRLNVERNFSHSPTPCGVVVLCYSRQSPCANDRPLQVGGRVNSPRAVAGLGYQAIRQPENRHVPTSTMQNGVSRHQATSMVPPPSRGTRTLSSMTW